MKLPRDLSGRDLVKLLGTYGYEVTRQTGSHIRVTTHEGGKHNLTIPSHKSLRVGTLAAILNEVAQHFGTDRHEIATRLFD